MKTYELTYIVSPEITLEEAEAKGKEIELAISSKEGIILKQLNPVAKTFSYPIGKNASGFLGVLEFQLESEKLIELEAELTKDVKIVRHMLIIKKPAEFKKERRTREKIIVAPVSTLEIERKTEVQTKEPVVVENSSEVEVKEKDNKKSSAKIKEIKEKVELKDIEQELDEILGE